MTVRVEICFNEIEIRLLRYTEIIQILLIFAAVRCAWIKSNYHTFPLSSSTAAEDHHVHFDTIKDDFESDTSNPVIQKGPHGKINVHLGFLQVKHRYRVELNIPAEILADYIAENDSLVLKSDETAVPNVHCKLLTFKGKTTEQSQFYEAEIEFFAHKEKLLKEELTLLTSDDKFIKLVFSARVLGRGKGTPMLKNNIHLLGIEDDGESGEIFAPWFESHMFECIIISADASDWQGFSRKECDEL